MKQRFPITILIASLMVSALAACGGSDSGEAPVPQTERTTTNITEAVIAEPESDGLPETDMQGWTLSILNFDESWLTWANTRILVDEMSGDILDDAIYTRNADLQNRWACGHNPGQDNGPGKSICTRQHKRKRH